MLRIDMNMHALRSGTLSCFPSQDLCSQLLEVAGIAPVGVQREIITSLPEILEDSQHNDTAKELK